MTYIGSRSEVSAAYRMGSDFDVQEVGEDSIEKLNWCYILKVR